MTDSIIRDIDEIRSLAASGRTAEAEAAAHARNTMDMRDFAVHVRWADALEELGLMDQVILELNLALRDQPDDANIIGRLAEIHLDQGQMEKACHYRGKLVDLFPQDADAYQALGQLLEETGEYGKAGEIYTRGIEQTGDEGLKSLLKELDFLSKDTEEPASADGTEVLVPASHHLVTFLALFSGREGVYARQWASPTGESGYTPVHEPFTLKVAEQHVLGNLTAGAYPLRLDQTVNFIAFDVDIAKPVVRKTINSKSAWDSVMSRVHQTACKLVDAGASEDLPVYIEDSGFKGRHAWIFLETPIPAGVARKCGHVLLSRTGALPPEVTVEVFPKQSRVAPGGLGNLIKLPLGIHKKTGRRSIFLEPSGAPQTQQLDFLETIMKTERRCVYALIQRANASSVRAAPPSPPEREEPPPWEESDGYRAPAVAEPPYDPDRDPRLQFLLLKCPVLKTIVERVNREASLTHDEAMVLMHSVGHLEQGPEAVNGLLERCAVSDPSLFMKSRLRGNPISCPKIRMRIPHITAATSCNCSFDPLLNLYPSPLNHMRELEPVKTSTGAGRGLDSIRFHQLVESYLKTRRQLRELSLQMDGLEKQLNEVFEAAGVEEIHTALGVLRRLQKENTPPVFALEI